jgi:hypothetical protein
MIKDLGYENTLNNSRCFKRNGLNIKTSQLLLNGQQITHLMTMPELYIHAMEFFNNEMKRAKTINSFQNEYFCFPYRLDITDDEHVSVIEWDIKADSRISNGGTPLLFICFETTIQL